jgi:hypothetical protein
MKSEKEIRREITALMADHARTGSDAVIKQALLAALAWVLADENRSRLSERLR